MFWDGICPLPGDDTPPLAVTTWVELLQEAVSGYTIKITPRPDGWAFEAIRTCEPAANDPRPCCLISRSPAEICEALTGSRYPALHRVLAVVVSTETHALALGLCGRDGTIGLLHSPATAGMIRCYV